MRFYFFLLCYLFFLYYYANSSSTPSNAELIQSLAKNIAREIVAQISQQTKDSAMVLSVEEHPLRHFFEYVLVNELSMSGFKLFADEKDSGVSAKLTLTISKFDISYSPLINSEDSLVRELVLSVTGLLRNSSGELLPLSSYSSIKDNISNDATDWIERDGALFKGRTTETRSNFLEKYVQPIVAVAASALVVILFFTIRSR